MDQLKEFNALIAEARLEAHRAPDPMPREVVTRHLTSHWSNGYLVKLEGDLAWIQSTTRQALVDELLNVLTPPEQPTESTVSRDRLARFLEG